jgi:hypothetical protein
LSTLIEASLPETWQELEVLVARILRECGYDVEVQRNVQLAGRGDVNIDVWADDHTSPPNVIAVECKHWATPVTKHEVHAFRVVVGDSGANTGVIVSSAGFQSGTVEAAAYSNVRLLDWVEFQTMFVARWFRDYMAPTLTKETEALDDYTEPINSRVARMADALPPDRRDRFEVLRERHIQLAMVMFLFHPVSLKWLLPPNESPLPSLPLRVSTKRPFGRDLEGLVPDDVLGAPALRPLMVALIEHAKRATKEFDEVSGGRA